MRTCRQCGLVHARLGVEIVDGVLKRKAKRDRHLLRQFGGAWAFLADLLDCHPEVEQIEITDERGAVYTTNRGTLHAYSIRRDLGCGEQAILPLTYWVVTLPSGGNALAPEQRAAQPATPRPRVEQLPLAI